MAIKRSLSPEARSILGASISRRSVLVGAGGLGAAGLLTACGGGGESETAESSVRWGNWPLYLDFDEESKTYPTLEKFKTQTGIDAQYFEDYNDNDEFFGKVQAQLKLGEDIGYDVVTPTDWMAARWIRLGYSQKFDLANIPNNGSSYSQISIFRFLEVTWVFDCPLFGVQTKKYHFLPPYKIVQSMYFFH
jgi:spermidine/putrescine transport system substrate-binding protein